MKNKTRTRKSTNNEQFYSVELVKNDNTFQVGRSFKLNRVNQYKQEWKRTNSREVARMLKNGKLVV